MKSTAIITRISCVLLDLPMYLCYPFNVAIRPPNLVVDEVHKKNAFSWLLSLPYKMTELIIRRIALPKFIKQCRQPTRHFTVTPAEGNLTQVAESKKGTELVSADKSGNLAIKFSRLFPSTKDYYISHPR